MRISDWSSDVCSSDLHRSADRHEPLLARWLCDSGTGQSRLAHLASATQKPGRCAGGRPPAAVRPHRPAATEVRRDVWIAVRSEEHTSELQSLMRISYAVFCLKKKTKTRYHLNTILRSKPHSTKQYHDAHLKVTRQRNLMTLPLIAHRT